MRKCLIGALATVNGDAGPTEYGEERPVIARMWRGWARADQADAYEAHYQTEVRESLEKVPGFIAARLLRREVGDEVEFVSLTFFDDLDALRAFAGALYETAVVADEARQVLVRYDDTVTHYDVPFTT
jgi:heme-degrading monooxygenase HmoA